MELVILIGIIAVGMLLSKLITVWSEIKDREIRFKQDELDLRRHELRAKIDETNFKVREFIDKKRGGK